MTDFGTELDRLTRRIKAEAPQARYRHQPQLRQLIQKMEAEGRQVPKPARNLHQELVCEAIEAQFDNLPV